MEENSTTFKKKNFEFFPGGEGKHTISYVPLKYSLTFTNEDLENIFDLIEKKEFGLRSILDKVEKKKMEEGIIKNSEIFYQIQDFLKEVYFYRKDYFERFNN